HDFAQTRGTGSEAYILMQNAVDMLRKNNVDPIRMSKVYSRLAENAFDYMYKEQDADKYLAKAFDYFDKSAEKDTLYLIDMLDFSGYMKVMSRNFEESIAASEKAIELLDQFNRDSHEGHSRK